MKPMIFQRNVIFHGSIYMFHVSLHINVLAPDVIFANFADCCGTATCTSRLAARRGSCRVVGTIPDTYWFKWVFYVSMHHVLFPNHFPQSWHPCRASPNMNPDCFSQSSWAYPLDGIEHGSKHSVQILVRMYLLCQYLHVSTVLFLISNFSIWYAFAIHTVLSRDRNVPSGERFLVAMRFFSSWSLLRERRIWNAWYMCQVREHNRMFGECCGTSHSYLLCERI